MKTPSFKLLLLFSVYSIFSTPLFLAPATGQEAKPLPEFKKVATWKTSGPNVVFHDLNGDRLPDLFVGRNDFVFSKPKVDHLLFYEAKRVGNSIVYEVKKSTLDLNPSLFILPG